MARATRFLGVIGALLTLALPAVSYHQGYEHIPMNGGRATGYSVSISIPSGITPNVVQTEHTVKHWIAVDETGLIEVNNLPEIPVSVVEEQSDFDVTICNDDTSDLIAEFWNVETGKTIRLSVLGPNECDSCGTGSDPICSVSTTTFRHPQFKTGLATESLSWGAVRARY